MTTFNDAETGMMVEELLGRAHLAVLNTLNGAVEKIYEESEKQVPKGPRRKAKGERPGPTESLAKRARVLRATPENPVAQVVYPGPYAAAQEVGAMTYESKGGKRVKWHATHYTTPGTKARYLSDPGKMVLGQVPEELAIQGRIAVGDLPGLITPKAELHAMGRQFEQLPLPPSEIQQIAAKEEIGATQATYLQRPPSAESLFKEE